jgi:hypothetical protein
MENWLAEDSASALAWAQALPPGATRDGALDMAAAQLAVQNPALATTLAQAISSPALRGARLQALAGNP